MQAWTLFNQGRPAAALSLLEVAIAEDRTFELLHQHALILSASGHVDKAEKFFEILVESYPGNAVGWFNRGIFLLGQGFLRDPSPSFEKAIQIDPCFYQAYNNLAQLYIVKENFDLAAEIYRRGLKALPENPVLLTAYAMLMHRLGDDWEVTLAIEKLSSEAFNQFPVASAACKIFNDFGRAKKTIEILEHRLAKWTLPEQTEAIELLGHAYLMLGNSKRALELFRKASLSSNNSSLTKSYAEAGKGWFDQIESRNVFQIPLTEEYAEGYFHLQNSERWNSFLPQSSILATLSLVRHELNLHPLRNWGLPPKALIWGVFGNTQKQTKANEQKLLGITKLVDINADNSTAEFLVITAAEAPVGLGAEVTIAMLDHIFNRLGLRKVYLLIYEDNAYAFELALRLGFKEEGRLRNHIVDGLKLRTLVQVSLFDCEFNKSPYLQRMRKRYLL